MISSSGGGISPYNLCACSEEFYYTVFRGTNGFQDDIRPNGLGSCQVDFNAFGGRPGIVQNGIATVTTMFVDWGDGTINSYPGVVQGGTTNVLELSLIPPHTYPNCKQMYPSRSISENV